MTIVNLINTKFIKLITKYKNISIALFSIVLIIIIIKNISFFSLKIKIKLPKTDSYVIVKYGNILKSKNNICLASSNLFNIDTNIIKKDNILGKIINSEYNNKIDDIDNELKSSLKQYPHKLVNVQHGGHNYSYPMGTVGSFTRKNKSKVYLIAITCIDDSQKQLKFESKKEYIDLALKNLWTKLRFEADNHSLSIPIIGTGISKSKNSKYLAILDICDSFINESMKQKIINNLEIFIYNNDLSFKAFSVLKLTLKELIK
jgi:hypothetical protein